MDLNTIFTVLFGLFNLKVLAATTIRTTYRTPDYVAPVDPCRPEDRLCSTKCLVMQMSGDLKCDFCVCTHREYYVKWDTTPDPSMASSPGSSTTLPPGQVFVNGIMYIEVSNPCDVVMDRMCPLKCRRRPSIKQDGSACTQCDCQGLAVLLGR